MSTESRDYEFGRIVSVDVVTLGDNLAADAASGAATITVEDAADFDEGGGQLVLNSVPYTYISCDDDTGVITLAGTLSAAAVEGDEVYVYDPQYVTVSTDKVAQVAVIGDDGSVDMLECAIALHLVDKVAEGIRGNQGEAVKLELDGGEWVVVDIAGLGDPNASGTLFYEDSLTVAATGVQTLNLTYEPIPHSEHLYWNGLYQPGSEWTRVAQVVTCADSPTGAVAVGDNLTMEYAYRKGIYAPPIAGVPYATEVLADSPLAWYRMGESGDYGSGGTGSDMFSGATGISLDSISGATANSAFTLETGEPFPTGVFANKSAWWSFTSPVDQDVRIDTQLSSTGSNVDTEMAVYTGGAVGSLTKIASDGDSGGNLTSLLTFAATAGVGYSLQVCAYNNLDMSYTVRLTGNRMADSSGSNRHGNYKAGGSAYLTKGVTGLLSDDSNKAAHFVAGQDCRGFVPYASWMAQTAFSVEFIIETTASTGTIAARSDTSNTVWTATLNAGAVRFARAGTSTSSIVESPTALNDGMRHHCLWTYDDTTGGRLLVDGVLVDTDIAASGPVSNTQPLTIAADNQGVGGGNFYDGILDEFAFYGTKLPDARSLAHYSAMVGG